MMIKWKIYDSNDDSVFETDEETVTSTDCQSKWEMFQIKTINKINSRFKRSENFSTNKMT